MQSHPGSLWTNYAVSGQHVAQMLADAETQVTPTYAGYSNVIVTAWICANDLSNDGATNYNSIVAYHNLMHAAGYKTAVLTVLPRGDDTQWLQLYETNRLALNALIRANWQTFANYLVDVAADGRLQDFNNTTYYRTDKVHLTDAGNVVVAALANGATPQAQSNLLVNPGFELGTGNTFPNWSFQYGTGGTAIQETTLVNSGTRALHLIQGTGGNISAYQTLTLVPNQKYRLTGYGRGNGVNRPGYIRAMENGGAYRTIGSVLCSGLSNYESAFVDFFVPADCAGGGSVNLQVANLLGSQGVDCYFDDITLTFVS